MSYFVCQRCGKQKKRVQDDFLLGDFGKDLGGDFGRDFSKSKGLLEKLNSLLTIEIRICGPCKKEIQVALGLSSVRETVAKNGKNASKPVL